MLKGGLHTRVDSPIGVLELLGDERSLWRIWMRGQRWAPAYDPSWRSAAQPFAEAKLQLAEYFAGERTWFELPLRPIGTPFQLVVWTALAEVPFGETRSYQALAAAIGHPSSARAVGLANGRNPLAVVLPCHRVIGSDGRLVGYGGGLERKTWLLEHEGLVSARLSADVGAQAPGHDRSRCSPTSSRTQPS